uniref:Uncharacterized protein n=2 Tax=Anguilla anguilla TaxID=7936 RepID=A0A0E9Q027_ANGAN
MMNSNGNCIIVPFISKHTLAEEQRRDSFVPLFLLSIIFCISVLFLLL